MAFDLALTGFFADGQNPVVQCDILGSDASPFNIAVFRTDDGVTPGTQVAAARVDSVSDLAMGSGHQYSLVADFADWQEDYYLLAVIDYAAEVGESNEYNNQRGFEGGVFQTVDGVVQIHGTDAADSISLSHPGYGLNVSFNGQSFTSWCRR